MSDQRDRYDLYRRRQLDGYTVRVGCTVTAIMLLLIILSLLAIIAL